MNDTKPPPAPGAWKTHRKGAVIAVVAAILWTILAWRTPTSTHHFAPLVAAGAWGFVTRYDELPNPSPGQRVLMFFGGLALPITAQVVLAVNDKLRGPPLLSAVPVPTELLLMAVLGAVAGSGIWRLVADREPKLEPDA